MQASIVQVPDDNPVYSSLYSNAGLRELSLIYIFPPYPTEEKPGSTKEKNDSHRSCISTPTTISSIPFLVAYFLYHILVILVCLIFFCN